MIVIDPAYVAAMRARLDNFLDDLSQWLTALTREAAIVAGDGGVWRLATESDRHPSITADAAPVNAYGRQWVAPDALDAAVAERDAAVADATRMRRLLWSVLRGLALSESQASAWLDVLLEQERIG